nr:sulfite exporter TauE/SafE family protein [uncultured Tyzzerella sp.]
MIWLFLVGLASGIISGMGIGGGIILIPALTIIFDFEQKAAQNISLLYFIPTAIIAIFIHNKNKTIEKKGLFKIILFGIVGAIVGSFIAINLKGEILRKIFGWFLLIMGISEIFKKKRGKKMELMEFQKFKEDFINADTDKKIEMYISTEGLTQYQYKELLKAFPYNEIDKLEKALA